MSDNIFPYGNQGVGGMPNGYGLEAPFFGTTVGPGGFELPYPDPHFDGLASPTAVNSESKKLACPFIKLDKTQHRECRGKRLRHIADVRLHLKRCHGEQPAFCPICKTIFKGNNRFKARDEHIRQDAPCSPRFDLPDPFWVNQEIMAQLKGMTDSGSNTEEQRWFFIWDKLFPNNPRPESIYHFRSASTEDTLDTIKSFEDHHFRAPGFPPTHQTIIERNILMRLREFTVSRDRVTPDR